MFVCLLTISGALGVASTLLLSNAVSLGAYHGIFVVLVTIILVYAYAIGIYRLFLRVMPLKEGELIAGSREEFAAQVNILFYLMLFNALIRTHFIPVPLMRLIYLALGARMGINTYSAGTLLDPALTILGDNCIVGHDAVLICHAIEGSRFALAGINVANDVTIGATAVIMSGVTIGNNAIVSAGAVVPKGTVIGPGEVWAGVPARRIK